MFDSMKNASRGCCSLVGRENDWKVWVLERKDG